MNELILRQTESTEIRRHSGMQTQRRFELVVNGVTVRHYADDSSINYYKKGASLDELIEEDVETFEKALSTQCRNEIVTEGPEAILLKMTRFLETIKPTLDPVELQTASDLVKRAKISLPDEDAS